MPEIFINGQPVQARDDETVLQAALRSGFYIPYFYALSDQIGANVSGLLFLRREEGTWSKAVARYVRVLVSGQDPLSDTSLIQSSVRSLWLVQLSQTFAPGRARNAATSVA